MMPTTLLGRTLFTRAAPARLQREVAVGDILAPAPPPPGAPAYTPPQPPPVSSRTLPETLGWAGSLLGLVSGAAFGLARGGLFPALGYGVLGTAVGTGAGLIVGNLVANPTKNPIG